MIGQLSHDVIGRLAVKPWCYAMMLSHDGVGSLWRLVKSLVHFGPSFVTVKQLFVVSQIVGCPVIVL